ncbi:MAG: ribonuclease III [Maricaulis sp.]|jgi:ribonuclease-3|nr:ribonuclease III [Maricaulis sp.]MDG2043952.1 ribonuclease III [Maricaulis sp.]
MADRKLALETRLNYKFKNRELFERSLTHASYGDGRKGFKSYERLEFLGDRVLGLLTAERLHKIFDKVDEGGLAPRLNALVRKEACADVARTIKLGEALMMAPSEEKAGGRDKTSILGDACEALIAALYLDGGMPAVAAFYDTYWSDKIEALRRQPKEAKSTLQEWAAKKKHGEPSYKMLGRKGPDHRPVFTVEVRVGKLDAATGEGSSKQIAERAAAAALLQREGLDVR